MSLTPSLKFGIINSDPDKMLKRNHKLASQINLIEMMNGKHIEYQDKDLEIERLQTTAHTLN